MTSTATVADGSWLRVFSNATTVEPQVELGRGRVSTGAECAWIEEPTAVMENHGNIMLAC
jgi:hypothetical protein